MKYIDLENGVIMCEYSELNCYPKLLDKLKTYYPDLDESSPHEVDNALQCVISGFPKEFCNNLKNIRIRLGYSQRVMAKKFNTSFVTYCYWENGVNQPRLSKLKEIFHDNYSFDPSEIISVNPVIQSSFKRRIPILPKNFFYGTSFEAFTRKLEKVDFNNLQTLETQDDSDYAFIIDDIDMIGYEKAIPVGAVVFCSIEPIKKNKNHDELLRYLNKKIAIVSITRGEPCLRQIFFDDEFLTLRPWNPTQPEKRFPVDPNVLSNMDNKEKEKASWNGIATPADSIEILGVAKKYIYEL